MEAAMRTDQDFLLYPLATEEQPSCPECGKSMTIATHEARSDHPDFSTSDAGLASGSKGLCPRIEILAFRWRRGVFLSSRAEVHSAVCRSRQCDGGGRFTWRHGDPRSTSGVESCRR